MIFNSAAPLAWTASVDTLGAQLQAWCWLCGHLAHLLSHLAPTAASQKPTMRVSIAALSISIAGAFSTSKNTLVAPRRPAAASSQLQMLDAAVIQGGAAAVGGLAVGLGMAWFSEQQVEQGEQRGSDAVSEATRAKMSAMFMEDEVLPDTTLDDTVSRMEAALAAAKGEAAVEEKVEEKPASSIDDGW